MEIEGYPNYAVSNYGQILNVVSGKRLRPRLSTEGALRVTLSRNGVLREFKIHHLVAQAFIKAYVMGEQVIHLNDDKTNNTPGNLRIRKYVRPISDHHLPILEGYDGSDGGRRWGRRVQIVETGQIFRTARDCARYIRGDYASIYSCLRGDRKSHRGYTFEYFDKEKHYV